MDIEKIGVLEDTATIELKHPITDKFLTVDDGGNTRMTITVYGRHSLQYRKVIRDIAQEMQKNGTKTDDDLTRDVDILARCTADWYIVVGGKTPKFTVDAARELYAKYSWIKDQVDAFIHLEKEAFLSGASAN